MVEVISLLKCSPCKDIEILDNLDNPGKNNRKFIFYETNFRLSEEFQYLWSWYETQKWKTKASNIVGLGPCQKPF